MTIDKRTYIVAGITRDKDELPKVRYSGDELEPRVKLYKYLGAVEVEFIELPQPMNKIEICKYLLTLDTFAKNSEYRKAIEVELAKKEALVAPKVPKKRGPKPKAKPAPVAKAPKAKKAAKAAPVVATPVLKKGEVETLMVEETYDHDDFDIRQFEQLAAADY